MASTWDDTRKVWLASGEHTPATLSDRQADAFAIQRGGMTKAQIEGSGGPDAFPFFHDSHGEVGKALAAQAGASWPKQPSDDWEQYPLAGMTEADIDEALAARLRPSDLPLTNPNGDQALKGLRDGYEEGLRQGRIEGLREASAAVQSLLAKLEREG